MPTSRPALVLTGLAILIVAGVALRQLYLVPPTLNYPALPPAELTDPADLSASLPAAESTPRPLAEPASPPVEPATPAETERAERTDPADLSASLPAAESTPRPLAEPASPP
ncbi:MAG: hypothetical protein OXP66_08485, partial [Candidatus Tectomicrobia bacterium]|nr:hypothetical protein [Candidatus Tectomicrobia bacterium]